MQGLIRNMIRLSKQRVDFEKTRHHTIITSDVQNKILMMNLKVKEDLKKKQTEELEKLYECKNDEEKSKADGNMHKKRDHLKLHRAEGETEGDADMDKDVGFLKTSKANEMKRLTDDRVQRKAANVAARAAVGGDDYTLKWQAMAKKAQQKCDGVFGKSSVAQQSKENSWNKSNLGENQSARPLSRVVRSISLKDLLATLEREPQMAKSAFTQRLRERIHSDGTAT